MTGQDLDPTRAPFRITLIATGGTIEKRYDPKHGVLTLDRPVIEELLDTLTHPDMAICVERIMARDSLEIGPAERADIVETVARHANFGHADAVVVTHGTDTLNQTAQALRGGLDVLAIPVVVTGAMIPFCAAGSDAAQNVAQALLACRLLTPDVYAVCHGRVIRGDLVKKDYERFTLTEG